MRKKQKTDINHNFIISFGKIQIVINEHTKFLTLSIANNRYINISVDLINVISIGLIQLDDAYTKYVSSDIKIIFKDKIVKISSNIRYVDFKSYIQNCFNRVHGLKYDESDITYIENECKN